MKLTKQVRDEVLEKIIIEKYKSELTGLYSAFVETVCAEAKSQHEKGITLFEYAKSIEAESYMNTTNNISIEEKDGSNADICESYSTISEIVQVDEPDNRVRIGESIPSVGQYRLVILNSSKIKIAARAVEKVFKDAEESYNIIKQVLYSANTSKQLVETLPEVEKYIPAESGCTAIVPVETINRAKKIIKENKHD